MKKLLLLFIPIILFSACNYNAKHYGVALSINESNSVIFHSGLGTNNYFETSVNSEITGKYFLVPDKDDKIEIEYLKSTDDSIIEITEVNKSNYSFKAIAKSAGNAKITVKTKSYGSSTSLVIIVK